MTQQESNQQIVSDALRPLRQKTGWLGKLWIGMLLVVCLVGLYAYIKQIRLGLQVTGMRDYVSWGIYISQFVFLVAVSLVGAIITSMLRLTNFEFRRPLTRVAELIAVSAIIFASISIIVDMGRPDRLLSIFIYGRIQSPIIWDVIVVLTYLVISTLLLYIPLIPDIAKCRDHLSDVPAWQRKLYHILALNWKDTPEQNKILHKAERILIILVIPVAVSIHTVTSWLFALTYRPGWDSTNFGPYFVAGAFVAGAGCVIIGMYLFRKFHGLKNYLTDKHFDYMGKLLVLLALVYLYFNVNEFFVPGFKMKKEEAELFHDIFTGKYSPIYWGAEVFGVLLPAIIPMFKFGRKPRNLTILSIFVVIAAWWKRFAIVIPTLANPFLPIQLVPPMWKEYFPTWEEWMITLGILAATLLLITFLARIFPIIPIHEVTKGKIKKKPSGSEKTDKESFELEAQ